MQGKNLASRAAATKCYLLSFAYNLFMELRHHIVVKGEKRYGEEKPLFHMGYKPCFYIFIGLFIFAVSRKWKQRNFEFAYGRMTPDTPCIDVNLA